MKKYSAAFLLFLLLLYVTYTYYEISDIKPVQATTMKTAIYQKKLNVTGEFENNDETAIMLSVPLCIKDVYIKENSYVNKGQALFRIDRNKMADIISGGFSEEIMSIFKDIDLKGLKNRFKSFSADNILNIPDVVYAPENGIIKSVSIYPGSISLPDQQLLKIEHTDNIIARFTLSQIDYGKINIGDKVIIKPIAFDRTSYYGTVAENNAIIKKQNTLSGNKTVVDVFASIDNPDKLVLSGLQINGEIHCGESQTIKNLPHRYLFQDTNNQYVYILENGKAAKRKIETGIETNDYIQILTKFDENTIFLSGDIKNGDRVLIME